VERDQIDEIWTTLARYAADALVLGI